MAVWRETEVPLGFVMEVFDEEHMLEGLRQQVQSGKVQAAAAISAQREALRICKEYKASVDKVTVLCEEVVAVEQILQVSSTDADPLEAQATPTVNSDVRLQLTEDVQGARAELSICLEGVAGIEEDVKQVEQEVVQTQEERLRASRNAPQLEVIQTDIKALLAEGQLGLAAKETAMLEVYALQAQMAEMQASFRQMQASIAEEEADLRLAKLALPQARAEHATIAEELKFVKAKHAAVEADLAEQTSACDIIAQQQIGPDQQLRHAKAVLRRLQKACGKKAQANAALQQQLDTSRSTFEELLAKCIDLEMAHEQWAAAMKREAKAQERLTGQQSKALMLVRKADEHYKQLKASNGCLEDVGVLEEIPANVEAQIRDLQTRQCSTAARIKELGNLKAGFNSFMAMRELEANAAVEVVRKARAGVLVLEEEVARLEQLEQDKAKATTALRRQRERQITSLADLARELSGVQQQEQQRLQTLAALRAAALAPLARGQKIQQLHSMLRQQRDTFQSLRQVAAEVLHTLKAKHAMVGHEIENMQKKLTEKAVEVDRMAFQTADLARASDALRQQLFRETAKREQVQLSTGEVEHEVCVCMKLLAKAVRAQDRHLERKLKAEQAREGLRDQVHEREQEAQQLAQTEVAYGEALVQGSLSLQRIQDDTRILRLKASDIEQSLRSQPPMPDSDEVARETKRMQSAIVQVTSQIEDLSTVLESTQSGGRWRLLDGPLPERHEMAARLAFNKEELERVSTQLNERDLVLIELTNLSEHLSFQAAARYPEALLLSQEMKEVTRKLQEVERQERAATGEAALHHAVCVELAAKLEQLHHVGSFKIVDLQQTEMLLERPDATVLILKDDGGD